MTSAPLTLLPPRPLRDGDVTLRRWTEDDLGHVLRLSTGNEVTFWTREPDRWGTEAAEAWIARANAAEGYSALAVCPDDAAPAGYLGLVHIAPAHRNAELAYWLTPAARGRGLMTRAVRLLSTWALREGGFERLEIQTSTTNLASRRTALKAGFVHEGVLRSSYLAHDGSGRHDSAVFSLIRADLAGG